MSELFAFAVSSGFSPHFLLPSLFSVFVLHHLLLSLLREWKPPAHPLPSLPFRPTTVQLEVLARLLGPHYIRDYLMQVQELISGGSEEKGNLIYVMVEL
jgi:hypothetical protein